ncbi:hypothetical protein GUITHDRAFT_132252 [Guillardia theta CCMP2712]|uniref:Uncharacterized protein n=1 Tax=Guillardia theta (strain CCMP2712) TaxID=905079 RepID=L1K1U1_GUITC|nr:hypothetical protein GUITHDRAFT_132252 [Guillardia theta CCMP2712]EKX54549.1 hypothetical protein GUITHDRAFT_132252 [Guillardia theta CCMP2712]|eukprot:XP_005841529.1 hypothetical protein GUITHDRAFT_132252 [Guillardia theta CCMP2712]
MSRAGGELANPSRSLDVDAVVTSRSNSRASARSTPLSKNDPHFASRFERLDSPSQSEDSGKQSKNVRNASEDRIMLKKFLSDEPKKIADEHRDKKSLQGREKVNELIATASWSAMEGIGMLFRGAASEDTIRGWKDIAKRSYVRQGILNATRKTVDRSYLLQIPNVHASQDQLVKTIESISSFIYDLDHLIKVGPLHRRRVVELGGVAVLVSTCPFIQDEELLLRCVRSLANLSLDSETRRLMVLEDSGCLKVLADVICAPHRPDVLESCLRAFYLLASEEEAGRQMVGLGALNAACTLCAKVGSRHLGVLRGACALLSRLARDAACLEAMTSKGNQLLNALFRVVRICPDALVCGAACIVLSAVCKGPNRILMGRHKNLDALVLMLEREVLPDASMFQEGDSASQSTFSRRLSGFNHLVPACTLITQLSVVQENRNRFISLGIAHPLIALILSRLNDKESSEAAKSAIKSIEDSSGVHIADSEPVGQLLARLLYFLSFFPSVTQSNPRELQRAVPQRSIARQEACGQDAGALEAEELKLRPNVVQLLNRYLFDQNHLRQQVFTALPSVFGCSERTYLGQQQQVLKDDADKEDEELFRVPPPPPPRPDHGTVKAPTPLEPPSLPATPFQVTRHCSKLPLELCKSPDAHPSEASSVAQTPDLDDWAVAVAATPLEPLSLPHSPAPEDWNAVTADSPAEPESAPYTPVMGSRDFLMDRAKSPGEVFSAPVTPDVQDWMAILAPTPPPVRSHPRTPGGLARSQQLVIVMAAVVRSGGKPLSADAKASEAIREMEGVALPSMSLEKAEGRRPPEAAAGAGDGTLLHRADQEIHRPQRPPAPRLIVVPPDASVHGQRPGVPTLQNLPIEELRPHGSGLGQQLVVDLGSKVLVNGLGQLEEAEESRTNSLQTLSSDAPIHRGTLGNIR